MGKTSLPPNHLQATLHPFSLHLLPVSLPPPPPPPTIPDNGCLQKTRQSCKCFEVWAISTRFPIISGPTAMNEISKRAVVEKDVKVPKSDDCRKAWRGCLGVIFLLSLSFSSPPFSPLLPSPPDLRIEVDIAQG